MKTLATTLTLALFLGGSQATNVQRNRYFPKHSWQTFGSEELLDVSILQSEELEQFSQKDLSKKLRSTLKDALISESAESDIGKSNAIEKAKYIGSIEKTMTQTIMAKLANSNDMQSLQQLQELKELNDQTKSIMKVQPAIEDMESRLDLSQASHTVKYTHNFVNALSELEKAIKEREVSTTKESKQDQQKATSLIQQKKHHHNHKGKKDSQETEAQTVNATAIETEKKATTSENVEDPLDGFKVEANVHALTEQEQRDLDQKDQSELKKLNEESEDAIKSSHNMVKTFEKRFSHEHKHDKSDLHRIHKLEKKLKEEYKLKEEQAEIHEKLSEEDAIKDLDHSVENVKENKKTYLKRELKKESQSDKANQLDSDMEKLNEQEEQIEAQKAELRNKLNEGKDSKDVVSSVQSKVQMGHYDNLAQRAIKNAQSLQQQYKRIDQDDDNDDDSNVQTNTFVNDDQQADSADFFDKY